MTYTFTTRHGTYNFDHRCDLDARRQAASMDDCKMVKRGECVVWRKPLSESEFREKMNGRVR